MISFLSTPIVEVMKIRIVSIGEKKTKREEKDEKLKKKIILPLAGFYDVVI
jgi:hypothetical protein